MVVASLALVMVLAGQPDQSRQTPVPQQPAASSQPTAPAGDERDLPVSLERIRQGLREQPIETLKDDRPVYRTQVFGRTPTIVEQLGLVKAGPVPRGSAAHQEFLKMVTPVDVQGFAPFSNEQGAVIAATSLANAMMFKGASYLVRKYQANRRKQAAAALKAQVAGEVAQVEQAGRTRSDSPK